MGWIRVDGGLTWHRKLIDLRARLGEPLAEAYLQRLWLWCHDNAPEGMLIGLDPASAVEIAVQWKGAPGALASALIDSGFIDRDTEGNLSIHDWEEHNGKHIEKAKADAKRAKKNRELFKKKKQKENANRSRTVRGRSADESGNGTERDGTERNGSVVKDQQDLSGIAEASDGPAEVFRHWQQAFNHPRAAFDSKRRDAVERQLALGKTVADLKQAIDGCKVTPHNQGKNERGEVYDDLELICRSAGQVERFMRNATSPPRVGAPKSNSHFVAYDPKQEYPVEIPPEAE